MVTIYLFIAVLIVFSVYWRTIDDSNENKDTFEHLEARLGKGGVDSDSIANSNIAANFQLLSLYPNIVFGLLGFFVVPVINALTFSFGTHLLENRIEDFQKRMRGKTIHGFVADAHKYDTLKKYTTIVSLLAFCAIVSFEVVFLSRILSYLANGGITLYYIFTFALIMVISIIVYMGGQKATVLSDNFHLVMGYAGLHCTLGLILSTAIKVGPPGTSEALSSDSLLYLITIYGAMMLALRATGLAYHIRKITITRFVIDFLILASIAYLMSCLLNTICVAPKNILPDIRAKCTSSFSGMNTLTTIAMIMTAICPALFYNFVDFSFWHRLKPLDGKNKQKEMRRGLRRLGVETTLSWILPLSLGALALTTIPGIMDGMTKGTSDPVSMIALYLFDTATLPVIGILFLVSVISIAVSTVDSYLSSLAYLYAKDMTVEPDDASHAVASKSGEASRVRAGRHFQLMVSLIMVFFFIIFDLFIKKTDLLISMFLTIFAPLTGLAPLVAWPLLTRSRYEIKTKSQKILAQLSSVYSGVAGIILGIYAVVVQATPADLLYWAPIPMTFIASWLFYFILIAKTPRIKYE